jgi:hypothetical protein
MYIYNENTRIAKPVLPYHLFELAFTLGVKLLAILNKDFGRLSKKKSLLSLKTISEKVVTCQLN